MRCPAEREVDWSNLRTFAFDHRMQLEEMEGYSLEKGGRFKELCLDAALKVQHGGHGFGILCDARIGMDALEKAIGSGLWIGRPCEWPGSRPLELEPQVGPEGAGLSEWASDHVVKVLCFCHPDDDAEMQAKQEATVKQLFLSARANKLEFLLEVIPSKVGPVDADTNAKLIQRFYDIDVYPDWWKLEPMVDAEAWTNVVSAIKENDPNVRGIVVLGLDAPEAELAASFEVAVAYPLVKGFAVGRSIFGDAARAWMVGKMSDEEAVLQMAARYERLCSIWDRARART
nr:DUF2090 domain-containing protein [uncultured Cohaesibacter sp.]